MTSESRIKELVSLAQAEGLPGQPQRDEPMARHSSFRLGGACQLYVQVEERSALQGWASLAEQLMVPYRVIGGGTNLLVAQLGIRGLIIENRCRGQRLDEAAATLQVESGASLAGLARGLARRGWAGLEWAAGIPGRIGGAVVNNAGAYGGAIAQVLQSVAILLPSGEIETQSAPSLELSYRNSRLKGRTPQAGVVTEASIALEPQPIEALAERVHRLDQHRRRTQPRQPSAGSVFINPPGDFAGRLIEAAGLKGARQGAAQISPLHANYIVNHGGASAQDVATLIVQAKRAVLEGFGIRLELEIEPIGQWEQGLLEEMQS